MNNQSKSIIDEQNSIARKIGRLEERWAAMENKYGQDDARVQSLDDQIANLHAAYNQLTFNLQCLNS